MNYDPVVNMFYGTSFMDLYSATVEYCCVINGDKVVHLLDVYCRSIFDLSNCLYYNYDLFPMVNMSRSA